MGSRAPGFEIIHWTRNPKTDSDKGTAQRNEALEKINEEDDWVVFLDDDTLLPSNYERTIENAIRNNPEALGFIFEQVDKQGGMRNSVSSNPPRSFIKNLFDHPEFNGLNGCDSGQMLFKRGLVAGVRWDAWVRDRNGVAPDHHFYNQVVFGQNRAGDVRWLNEVASIHNALR